jgi:hypothetical protein
MEQTSGATIVGKPRASVLPPQRFSSIQFITCTEWHRLATYST